MFLKEDNNKFEFQQKTDDYKFPVKLLNVEYTNTPYTVTGEKSGSYLLAQFIECVKFQFQNESKLDTNYIESELYNAIRDSTTNYITFSNGMEKVCEKLKDIVPYVNNKDLVYFNSSDMVKRYLHKNNYVIVEMNVNSAYINTTTKNLNNVFYITQNGSILTTSYTKGFICVGYDNEGFVLFNNLGKTFGSCGFIKVSNDIFNQNLIKGCSINIL